MTTRFDYFYFYYKLQTATTTTTQIMTDLQTEHHETEHYAHRDFLCSWHKTTKKIPSSMK